MDTKFVKRGSGFFPTPNETIDIRDQLPPGTYMIRATPNGELYFDPVENFTLPKKLYGETNNNAERIFNTFMTRPNGTGVMLTGEKGSGKTLLAKKISLYAMSKKVPTILINAEWHGEVFNQLIQSVNQPAVLIFDEFEKVYENESQEDILTLLDGSFPTKKLFIFTCNDKWKVNAHMRNRPGRVFYYMEYKGIEPAFIREYCQDNLKAKEYTNAVVTLAQLFDNFNFDMLVAVVEEMNRYNEDPREAIRLLNVRPEFSEKVVTYLVEVHVNGRKVVKDMDPEALNINPLKTEVFMVGYTSGAGKKETWNQIHVLFKHLVNVDADTGTFTYENPAEKWKVTLTKKSYTPMGYDHLL